MEKKLVVDLGNGAVKLRKTNGDLVVFKATTKLNADEYDLEGKHEITLHQDGNDIYYVIADDDGEYCVNERRYVKEDYKALLLTAIGVAFADDGDNEFEVDLGINLPLQIFKAKKMDKILKSKFEGKTFEFKVDQKEYKVLINTITPLPENLVVSLLPEEKIKHKNLFFDLGNGTIDVLFSEGGKLGAIKTEYNGIDKLIDKISEKSGARKNQIIKYWNNLSDISVKGNKKNLVEIQSDTLMDYVSDLLELAEKQNGGNLDDVDTIYLLGGGANLIVSTLKNYINNNIIVFDNPQFANLICMEKMFDNL